MELSKCLFLGALIIMGTASVTLAAEEEDLLSCRHIARAHYENEHFAKAAEVYRQCVELAPGSVVDRINLAVAEGKARETEACLATARVALSLDDSYLHSLYMIGLMSFRLGDMEATAATFATLLERDPFCTPALYAYGQALYNLGRKEEAIDTWERVMELDENHSPTLYQLFRYYTAAGNTEMAAAAFEEFTRIKQSGLGPGKTQDSIFRYRYFDLLDEVDFPAQAGDASANISVTLSGATAESGLGAAAVMAIGDFDEDGDEDIFAGPVWYRNDGGVFAAQPVRFPLPDRIDRAAAGDLDNDGLLDLALIGDELTLLRGNGLGSFETFFATEATAGDSGTPGVLRLVDIDHEGDLDILFAPAGGYLRLLRNNGNSTFTDVTGAAGMSGVGPGLSTLLVSDLESDFDIDVFATGADGRHYLFVNERDGTFLPEAQESGLLETGPTHSCIVGDVNNDGNPDLVFFGGSDGATDVWLNRGDARFHRDRSSPVLARRAQSIAATAGHLTDLDNDGDLDLVASGTGFAAFRNDGAGGWTEWPLAPGIDLEAAVHFVDRDFDGDADADLVVLTADGLEFLRNHGGNQNHRVRLRLTGTKNCLDGYGAKVWTRAGRFFQTRETFRRWIDLGVGDRTTLDVLGVRWPTGVTQNEIGVTVGEAPVIEITERPGLAESCPFVYAFNGERFGFVTDILDVGPLGISLAPGVPFMPSHREAILISGDELAVDQDRYSIRVTQELREITYLDRVELFVVDHPAGSSVLPNDHFSFAGAPPRGIHFVGDPQVPVSATNENGEDVLDAVLANDRVYVNDCEPISSRYPGITDPHELILDPGPGSADQPLMLFLRATMLWTEASINVAISQNPDIDLTPISLDVIGVGGDWVRVREDIGVPAGMNKFLPVDLDGLFPTADRRVRLSTNMAVLWDEAFFAAGPTMNAQPDRIRPRRLAVLSAELGYRGFSRVYSPDDKLPDLYDYDTVLPEPLFTDVQAGDYTRYGDVAELLTTIDDRFVVLAPGDEIAIEFPAIMLPEIPDGWVRDFIFEAEGWIKDGDLRTRTGHTVAPLPFHAMSTYPYDDDESYPTDSPHRSYVERIQTRTLPLWGRSYRLR